MHTTGDGLVVPENEQAYASVVRRAGRVVPAPPGVRQPGRALRVHPGRDDHRRPGPAAPDADRPLGRPALRPASLNAAAAALGPNFNIFVSGGKVVPVAPAFMPFRPTPYLRPFDLGFSFRR